MKSLLFWDGDDDNQSFWVEVLASKGGVEEALQKFVTESSSSPLGRANPGRPFMAYPDKIFEGSITEPSGKHHPSGLPLSREFDKAENRVVVRELDYSRPKGMLRFLPSPAGVKLDGFCVPTPDVVRPVKLSVPILPE